MLMLYAYGLQDVSKLHDINIIIIILFTNGTLLTVASEIIECVKKHCSQRVDDETSPKEEGQLKIRESCSILEEIR